MAYTKAPLLPSMLQAYQAPTFQQNPLLGFQPNVPKASLYGRLFDRVTPQNENSPYALEDEQKKRLFRQGLLQFGVAALQPNGGNTGAAIARGLLAGTQGLNEGARQYADDAYKADKMKAGLAGENPAGYVQFERMAAAAGLKPGTPEYQEAAQIQLGQVGRATNAGYSFDTMEGADGKKRIIRRNPRDPNPDTAVEIYDETTGGFVPMGGTMVASAAPVPTQAAPMQMPPTDPVAIRDTFKNIADRTGFQITSTVRPVMPGVGAGARSQHPKGTAADFSVAGKTPEQKAQLMAELRAQGFEVIDESDGKTGTGPHIHAELPPMGRRPASPALSVGRSAEEEAAAVQAAKAGVDLQYAPAMGAIDVQTAGGKARAEAEAKLAYAPQMGQVEAQIEGDKTTARTAAETQASAAKRARDSKEALRFLDEAEGLLKKATGGRVGALGDASARLFNYTTEGAKAASQLDILGAKLVANVPRFEGPQSNIDVQMYMQAAGDLANREKSTGERLSALQQMRKIANSYATPQAASPGAAPGAPRRLKFNPATGKLE